MIEDRVEAADQVAEELAAGLAEGEMAGFVEPDAEPGQAIGDATLLAGTLLGLQPVDRIDAGLVDGHVGEVEAVDVLGQRQLGDDEPVPGGYAYDEAA
jgi:hypothetical protein